MKMQLQTSWYNMDKTELIDRLDTHPGKGLSWKEADKRLQRFGENRLEEQRQVSPFTLLLHQFKDFMVLVLLAATLISGLLGEYTDAITIIAIVILNGILGFVQEYRAEKSLKALKELTAPTAQVIRNGNREEIPATRLVPGDIVYFESGDRIPADIRILEAHGLHIDESPLTGESVPVHKEAATIDELELPVADQYNMLFMGTMVTAGSGRGVVVETGMTTEMGKIADLLQTTETLATPLQKRLEQLGKVLVGVAIALTFLVVFAGIWHGHEPYDMFLAGVSLAVAAIPEGLPAIVTISLALGVQRMIKRKAIVRKLPSVETLGCATVICSDKTGTLTQNKMTVTHMWTDGKVIEVTGNGYQPSGEFLMNGRRISVSPATAAYRLLQYGVLCNNSELEKEKNRGSFLKRKPSMDWTIIGDPTDGSLLVAAAKAGIWKNSEQKNWIRLNEFPFDSSRKMMSVLVKHQKGERKLITKGAPDVLIDRCSYILENGKLVPFSPSKKQQILKINDQLAGKALRNLAVAYRDVKPSESLQDSSEAERGMILIGLMGIIDPPRVEVKQAIRECQAAGIKTVMITGDHQLTAEAIGRELGILHPGGLTVNGKDIYNMSGTEWMEKVNQIDVYARVSPEHKLRIVKALQAKGHVVAMTGDGVNDAPAIKAADIGIAMGITGTDVTKEASSLVLSDDNFATIKAAIEEGRTIYDNIRKFIRYLLASNVGEILVMFLAMMAGMPLPLVPIQILWVNLVTDGLPAMALGVDSAEEDTMKRPPRPTKEGIFARGLGWKIISRGFLIGISTLGAFWISLQQEPENLMRAQTMAFTTLVMAQLLHVFDCRSEKSIFHRNPFGNLWLVLSVIISVILMVGVIYLEPLQPVFHTVSLDGAEWIVVMIFASIPTFLIAGFRLMIDQFLFRKNVKWANNL